MKPVSWQYSNIDKHGDDQINTFTLPGVMGVIICDGVSSSSCGHIAAAFTSWYIREYIEHELKPGMGTWHYKELTIAAVQFAGKKLSDFALKITKLQALNNFKSENALQEEGTVETASVNTDPGEYPSQADRHENILYEKDTEPVTTNMPVWDEYEMICKAFKYPAFNRNKEKIIQLLNAHRPVFFECTLTLNLVYQPEHADHWEILSVNYGDSEFHVICWDKTGNKITAFLPHYKLSQDALRSYISSEGKIVTGNPVILTRNLNKEDTILLSSDGAYLHYTTRGGFPYEPFKRKFNHIKVTFNTLAELPETWFKYLNNEQAANDDFSLVIIEFF